MKKWTLITLFIILLNTVVISAINLEVSSKPISNSYIIDLDEPAVYELTIKNLGEKDNFEIYSLVGIDITHDPLITIRANQTKTIRIELSPQSSLKTNRIPFTFEYKISDSKNDIQKETLSMNILDLKSVFLITPEPINPSSEKMLLSIKNNIIFNFSEISINTTSAFFEQQNTISLQPNELKAIEIEIDKERLKFLDAGTFLMNSKITANGITTNIESQIKFLEQEGIETIESKEGSIARRAETIKKNTGNVKKLVTITTERNILSYLFTTTNIPPTKTETTGFVKTYTWEKELNPNEELKVIVKTNWFYPLIIIIIIIFGTVLIRKSIYSNLELIKRVTFVKTKGGEFALKITIIAKAKKSIENISIIDRLPRLVKLYNKFGIIPPDKIDLENRKLEWKIDSLNKDETRIFTYIIYSKIGVVGRFELPEAKAIYEHEGEIKEASSNRSFYVNEPRV